MSLRRSLLGAVLAAAAIPALAAAQDSGAPTRYVLSIGHHPRVDGLRLNFRDREFDLVRGANITIWQPYRNADLGRVEGFAVGLPMTGVGQLRGIGVGVAGLSVEDDSRGILIGGIGVGAGGELEGITIGGIGAAAGDRVSGITIGGIGVGAGGTIRGIAIGGIGTGAGGDVRGLAAGGIGVGAGGDVQGAALGGIGVGAGGNVRGLAIGGIGVGAGGQLRGIAIGGLGVGAGDMINGAAIAGLGVGSERIEGLAIGPLVRARETRAIIIAPVLFRSFRDADVRGATVSGVNVVYGSQRGLAIGVVNYTESLNGVQLGVVNIVRDNPSGRRVLPVVNWGNDR
jgi:hypothetical protein